MTVLRVWSVSIIQASVQDREDCGNVDYINDTSHVLSSYYEKKR